jgi:SNF2 family DNA or RNA helicase
MNKYLVKIAKKIQSESDDARPHVDAAHAKLEKNDGLILHWGTGSGKTKFFLDAASRAQAKSKDGKVLIVAPASLVTNIDKELDKHKIKVDRKRLDVYSYEKATRIAPELKKNKYLMSIADEAQRLRNTDTQRTQALSEIFEKSDKRILATATANYNSASDIAPLVNMAYGGKVLPENKKEFEKRFIGKEKKRRSLADYILGNKAEEIDVLKNKKELGDLFKDHVHYYDVKDDPEAQKHFPKVTEKTIEVEMSPKQSEMYKFVEGNIPFWLRMKIRHNLPLDKKEKAELNSFSTGVRQVSNSHRHLHQDRDEVEYTPKIEAAVKNLKAKLGSTKNFKALVYSNYLDAGVHEYSRKLQDEGIPHVAFTGQLDKKQKDEAVKNYNSGKVPVLLISSSGAEGLDLKGTRLTQVLDPHFNPSKGKQIKGRGARYKSHEHLPEEDRNMEIENYLTTHKKPMFGAAPTSIDKYLSGMSDDKDKIFSEIKQVMKEST